MVSTKPQSVRFGLIYTHLYDDTHEASPQNSYERSWSGLLEHVVWAESVGFESVWLAERHSSTYPPSPLIVASALAARTRSVRIGTNLMVAPLHHPLRLAEDAASVSVLSDGRFDLGLGQGHKKSDFESFGVEMRFRPSLLEETVTILRRAWSGHAFGFEGKRYRIPEGTVVQPVPAAPPRILVGATSEAGMARAARISDGFLSAFNGHIRQFVDLASQAGAGADLPIFAAQQAIIADDPEREWSRVGPHAMDHANRNLPGDQQMTKSEEVLNKKMIALWDADKAVESIVRLIQRHPTIEDVHFLARGGPGESWSDTYERLEFLSSSVLPRVRTLLGDEANGRESARTP
ncbi:LLM class flavin-dependent oxidoreductase [Rhodococcus ruber]|uniref:LLM class flavin-dependent oxidoreductase n=2 Tax=Rhodococcus ruber TaxID=1830 RepID=A0ABT4MEQ0_9NOCA|nr:LLM class flavin-dependent oxidoreductase [Rhodococcus ruber]MCZ4519464.1 LLM class flavin-dependent oxidoreductase [Rhodococcus ruber]